jgi:Xaa-Pro aminopeptidase
MAVMDALSDDPALHGYESSRVYMTAGGTIGPNTVGNPRVVADGDIVWIDSGVRIEGYEADIGRTFQVGKPDPLTEQIAGALLAGSEAGFKLLTGPGVRHCDVYAATQEAVRANGIPWYTRGHFGHGIGVGGGEQHPFIEADEERVFEPGMCFAYERPYYVRGLGGFQNEDNYAVTEDGIEQFTTLPQGLIRI